MALMLLAVALTMLLAMALMSGKSAFKMSENWETNNSTLLQII